MIKTLDVIEKAIELTEKSKIHKPCVNNCIFCAIANAKTDLDIETGEGVPDREVWMQIATGRISERPEDEPLIEAANLLRKINGNILKPFSKKKTLKILNEAKDELLGKKETNGENL